MTQGTMILHHQHQKEQQQQQQQQQHTIALHEIDLLPLGDEDQNDPSSKIYGNDRQDLYIDHRVDYHDSLVLNDDGDDLILKNDNSSSSTSSSIGDTGGVPLHQPHSPSITAMNNGSSGGKKNDPLTSRPYSKEYPNTHHPFNVRYLYPIPTPKDMHPLSFNVLPLRKDYRFGAGLVGFVMAILNLFWALGIIAMSGVEFIGSWLFIPSFVGLLGSMTVAIWVSRLPGRVSDRLIITSYPTSTAVMIPPPPKKANPTKKPRGLLGCEELSLAYSSTNSFREGFYYINIINIFITPIVGFCFLLETVLGSSHFWILTILTFVLNLLFGIQNYSCAVMECASRREYQRWSAAPNSHVGLGGITAINDDNNNNDKPLVASSSPIPPLTPIPQPARINYQPYEDYHLETVHHHHHQDKIFPTLPHHQPSPQQQIGTGYSTNYN